MEMRVGQRNGRIEVETLEQAVARDVGEDDGGNTGILETPRDLQHRDLRDVSAQPSTATLPSRASSPTATRPGNFFAAALTSSGSRTAAVPMMTREDALGEPGFDGREIADAATELHRNA